MTDVFHQIYNPVGGSVLFSALVASVPGHNPRWGCYFRVR